MGAMEDCSRLWLTLLVMPSLADQVARHRIERPVYAPCPSPQHDRLTKPMPVAQVTAADFSKPLTAHFNHQIPTYCKDDDCP